MILPDSLNNSVWPEKSQLSLLTYWSRDKMAAIFPQVITLLEAITWTNLEFSSDKFSGIHLRAILPEITQPPISKINM